MTDALPFRGVYFASHFDNCFQTWPLDELDALIGDYASHGAGWFMNWFDLNEVTQAEVSTPGSPSHRYLHRVRAMNAAARRHGMRVVGGTLANACQRDQYDPSLAADTSGWSGRSAYKNQLCLSNPKARDLCMANTLEVVRSIAPIDALSVWTYDQGGCDCARCAPYSVTCARFARDVQDAIGKDIPVCLSVWHMPDDQAAAMLAEIARLWDTPPLLFFNHDSRPHHHGPDAGRLRRMKHFDAVRAVGFPEIAMIQDDTQTGTFAWNLFGANPMPRYFTDRLRQQWSAMHGILTYSEGVYDHLNQYALLRVASDRNLPVDRALADYAATYLTSEVSDSFVDLVHRLERQWLHMDASVTTGEAEHLAGRIDAALPAQRRVDFRWRVIRLRTQLDHLVALGRERGRASVEAELQTAFAELAGVYCATDRTWPVVNIDRLAQSPGRWW